MFESKRVTREEQTLVIDDAEMIGIMPSGGESSSFVVNFKMERDGVETHLHVHLHRSHIEAIKGAQVLTVPQLKADMVRYELLIVPRDEDEHDEAQMAVDWKAVQKAGFDLNRIVVGGDPFSEA